MTGMFIQSELSAPRPHAFIWSGTDCSYPATVALEKKRDRQPISKSKFDYPKTSRGVIEHSLGTLYR